MNRIKSHFGTALACARGAVLVLALSLTTAGLSATTARADTSFVFAGSGYGHGIGLSQYGAKGYAEHGWKGEAIATHYFPGTVIGTVADPIITVNVDPDKTSTNGGFTQTSWKLRAGTGSHLVVNGSRALNIAGDWTFTGVNTNQVRATDPNGKIWGPWAYGATITAVGSSTLIEVVDGSGIYDWTHVRYRGSMQFKIKTNVMGLLNVVKMQDYLYGVVPRESPASWPLEELKAQAIVARGYAYYDRAREMYCTTVDQAYSGHSRYHTDTKVWEMLEQPSSNSAVSATAGKYVKFGSTVVQTFFSSSSGGRSAAPRDVWGPGASNASYFQSVDDPYCVGPWDPWVGPYTGLNGAGTTIKYPRTITGLSLAAALAPRIAGEPAGAGTTVYVKSLAFDTAISGFVRTFDVTWSTGAVSSDIDGDIMRQALKLPSTKFHLNNQFTRIALGDRYETAVKVSQTTFKVAGVDATKAVVLANGTDAKFADALTAAALAGQVKGPVLIVPGSTMPAVVKAELTRLKTLGFTKVYVIGGTTSISTTIETLAKNTVGSSERLKGSDRYGYDRYGTAASVAMKMKTLGASGLKVLVASGESWPDAAVAAAIAAGSHRPVVLTGSRSLPTGSVRVLDDLGATESAVFGGASAITAPALAAIIKATGEVQPAKRFGTSGSRYDVAVEASKWAVSTLGFNLSTVYVASGEKFPDSVTGGLMAGRALHPLLLTPSKSASTAASNYFSANRATITSLVVVGGTASVSDAVASTLGSYAF